MRSYALPWDLTAADNQRFNKILLWTLGITLVLSILLSALPLVDRSKLAPPELPQRMARLLLEPEPQPKKEEAKPAPQPEKPVERKVEAPLPKKPERVVETIVPDPQPQPVREAARERAAKAGIMAFADQLADLRDAVPDQSLRNDTRVAATGDGKAQRALITSAKGTSSAGIDTSAMSRATGGGGLAGRQTTRVTTQAPARVSRSGDKGAVDSSVGGRSREEIEQVFDRNKAAIYALYRRALRADPTLEGKVVLTLTIAPSGSVTEVRIVSSELSAPELEEKLVRRIRMFDFGARDVSVTTTTKPIDFFPA